MFKRNSYGKNNGNGFVYFVEANGKVKIGRTKRPLLRLKEIISGSGNTEDSCKSETFRTGCDFIVERLCHNDDRISDKRIGKTEWFEITADRAREVIISHLMEEEEIDSKTRERKFEKIKLPFSWPEKYSKDPELHLSQSMASIVFKIAKEKGISGALMEKAGDKECSRFELMLSIYFYKNSPTDTYATISSLENSDNKTFVNFMLHSYEKALEIAKSEANPHQVDGNG